MNTPLSPQTRVLLLIVYRALKSITKGLEDYLELQGKT